MPQDPSVPGKRLADFRLPCGAAFHKVDPVVKTIFLGFKIGYFLPPLGYGRSTGVRGGVVSSVDIVDNSPLYIENLLTSLMLPKP